MDRIELWMTADSCQVYHVRDVTWRVLHTSSRQTDSLKDTAGLNRQTCSPALCTVPGQ